MCGIAGLIVKQSDTLESDLINMLKELVHRGRDATGLAIYEQRDNIQAIRSDN
jgi:glucosamine 6-phosphate synthetase-like amidotransferase/phosphosugar isomerase protein